MDLHSFLFLLFFVGVSAGLAAFFDFALGQVVSKQGKVEKIVLRIFILVVAICTTLQASVMLGFIKLVK